MTAPSSAVPAKILQKEILRDRSVVEEQVDRALDGLGGPDERPLLLVAFSGGPDSLALLLALSRLRHKRSFELHACHVDHGLDARSGARACRARELAESLGLRSGVGFHSVRLAAGPTSGESPEAWARHRRYGTLEKVLEGLGGGLIATAHHRDDQAETLLLRLLFGTGLPGMAGIRFRRGRLIRPFLGLHRRELLAYLSTSGLGGIDDPTNFDLSVPRNRIRHRVLPEWKKEEPHLVDRLCRVAVAVAGAVERIEEDMKRRLRIEPLADGRGARLNRRAFARLPDGLEPYALSALESAAGRVYPTPSSARSELLGRLGKRGGHRISCDCGKGWRWYGDSRSLRLLAPDAQPSTHFTYTLVAPGSVDLVEVGVRATISRKPRESWMSRFHAHKVGFDPVSQAGPRAAGIDSELSVEIRNRRPGDRIRPFGSSGSKKLKDLLIDRRIPREDRDAVPVFLTAGRPIWVPGVTLDESCRLAKDTRTAWTIELEAMPSSVRHILRGPFPPEKGS